MTSSSEALQRGTEAPESRIVPRSIHLAILNNFIPPYWKPVFTRLSERYPSLRLFVSTPMEPNRAWEVDWEGLDVVLQKTFTLRGNWRHPKGFQEPLFIHFPVDTIRQLRSFHADVVLSAEMGFRTLMSLAFRKLHRRSKLMIWAEIAESTERGRGMLRFALRRILARHADAFIVFGDSGARYVRTLRVPDSKIFIVPYSTDASRFAGNPLARTAEHAQRLLYVGQLIERKGILLFIEVVSRWAASHPERLVTLCLAGDGPLREKLERVSVPANLQIQLLGNVHYQDIPRIYAESGIFVFPTLADTWGLVVNEALASGLPVLGSVYSQAVEMLVTDGHNGWTYRPDDPEQTYSALDRCMNTGADVLAEMRERARASAVRLTPEYVAGLLDAAVMACLREKVGSREASHGS